MEKAKEAEIVWLTTKQLAEFTNLSPGTIRNKVSRSELPCYKFGGRVLFDKREINDLIKGKIDTGRKQDPAVVSGDKSMPQNPGSRNSVSKVTGQAGSGRLPGEIVSTSIEGTVSNNKKTDKIINDVINKLLRISANKNL